MIALHPAGGRDLGADAADVDALADLAADLDLDRGVVTCVQQLVPDLLDGTAVVRVHAAQQVVVRGHPQLGVHLHEHFAAVHRARAGLVRPAADAGDALGFEQPCPFLRELGGRALGLGDVADVAGDLVQLAVVEQPRLGDTADPPQLAVGAHDPVLDVDRVAGDLAAVPVRLDHVVVVRVHDVEHGLGAGHDRAAFEAEKFVVGVGPDGETGLRVVLPRAEVRDPLDLAQPALFVAQRVRGGGEVGHVDQQDGLQARPRNGVPGDAHRQLGAVRAQQPQVGLVAEQKGTERVTYEVVSSLGAGQLHRGRVRLHDDALDVDEQRRRVGQSQPVQRHRGLPGRRPRRWRSRPCTAVHHRRASYPLGHRPTLSRIRRPRQFGWARQRHPNGGKHEPSPRVNTRGEGR